MFLTILTFLSAISISVIAAGYSIIGLATLFAGAVIPIILMGSALEVGKLVAASWLYHNWNSDVPRLLKAYLFSAIIILIFITSMGIFGFLSKAHLDQVKPTSSNNIKIELLDNQIKSQQLIIDRSQKTLTLLDKALEVYIDKEFVTRGLKERKKQEPERLELNTAIKEASNEIAKLSEEKGVLSLEQNKIEAEVGPIKYVAELIYGENAQDNFDSPEEADVSTAAANLAEKPCFLIMGMVNTPVPAILAATEPLIMPNTALATIAAWAAPLRIRPVRAVEIRIKLWPAPVCSNIAPKIKNISTVLATKPVVRPNTPSKEYHAICIKLPTSIPKCFSALGRCGPAKPKTVKNNTKSTRDQPHARRVASNIHNKPIVPAIRLLLLGM